MTFLEIIGFILLFCAVVALIIGFCLEPEVVKGEVALWRRFRCWLARKLRSSKKFMMWLNGEKEIKDTYILKVRIIDGWQNYRY